MAVVAKSHQRVAGEGTTTVVFGVLLFTRKVERRGCNVNRRRANFSTRVFMPKICPICNRSYSDDNAFCPVDGTTLRADVTGDLIGSVIADRYLITDLLGEGGMGRVYLGRHVRLPQQAAIKVLRDDLVQDRASIARFNREASSASQIQSDYVARVYDFGETQDKLVYLAMEYVPGRTLRNVIEAEGPLPLPRTATIISQIAEGLDAAHRLGIIHRDLKPDNVIIAADDEIGDRAKVVDFGIAKGIGGDKEGQITSTGFVVGTPDFMSPEQLLNEAIDARSDVYALGLVAYNMLTGVLPFEASTPSKGLMARLVEEPAPLSRSNPRGMWSVELQQVFDKVLARSADDRYATAREFAQALREAAGIGAPAWGAIGVTGMTSSAGNASASQVVGAPGARQATEARSSVSAVPDATSVAVDTGAKSRRTMLMVGGGLAGVAAIAAAVVLINGKPDVPVESGVPATQTASTPSAPADSTTSLVAQTMDSAPTVPVTTSQQPEAGRGTSTPPVTRGSDGTSASNPNPETPAAPPARASSITASIDSVRNSVDMLMFETDDAVIPGRARAQIQRIDALLPRARNVGDSARLYLLSANASRLAGDDVSACATLKLLGKLAISPADQRSADRYHQQWGCNSPWR